jgi:TonB family protein
MEAGVNAQATDAAGAVRVRSVAVPNPQERVFGIAFACALLMHAALLIAVTRSQPQYRLMGEKSGRPDGISVELVEAADLDSKNSVATEGAPGIALLPAPPPAKATPPPKPQDEKSTAHPAPKEAAELAPPPAEKAAKSEASISEDKKQETPLWPPNKQALDLVHPRDRSPSAKSQREAAVPRPPVKPAPPQAPQQLKIPDTPFLPTGGVAGFARPAGITRSGENDEFGRGVIRALRKTMPPPRPEPAQVTVRFVLSDYGNLVELRLERSSGDPVLDQSVMFSVKQSSFPFPPVNAPVVDRTFLVTYVYR